MSDNRTGLLAALALTTLPGQSFADVSGYRFDHERKHPAPYTMATEYEPTEDYETRRILGFTVKISAKLREMDPERTSAAIRITTAQLTRLTYLLEPTPLRNLRKVTIWITHNPEERAAGLYHPDRQWLIDNGRNPDWTEGVELPNFAFSKTREYTLQPSIVIHELAHAYHHQFLDGGFDNPLVFETYNRASLTRIYDYVLHSDGRYEEAYAMTNQNEYYAETTEAYLATNNSYPFVSGELKQYDRDGYRTMISTWIREGIKWHPCRDLGKVRSTNKGHDTRELTFANDTDETRRIFWLNGLGDIRRPGDTIQPGEEWRQTTWPFHAWLLTDEAEKCVGIVVPGTESNTVKINR